MGEKEGRPWARHRDHQPIGEQSGQMGGWVEPLWGRRDSHPGPSSHFVRVYTPLVRVPVQVKSLIMDIHVNYSAPATTGCETSLLDEASLFA